MVQCQQQRLIPINNIIEASMPVKLSDKTAYNKASQCYLVSKKKGLASLVFKPFHAYPILPSWFKRQPKAP
jgi:hypothetical protein